MSSELRELSGKPDYTFKALNLDTNEKGDIGVAWVKQDGTILVRFNPFIEIPRGRPLVYTLFPAAK